MADGYRRYAENLRSSYGQTPAVRALPLGASRVFHRAPDGTVPYFRSEGGMQEEGRLPEGADPAQLLSQGYVEADRDTFLEARTRLDPLRPVPTSAPEATVHLPGRGKVRMDTADAHAYADETDAALASMASPAPVADSPEDVGALGSAFDDAYAPGLARQQAALEAATAPTPRTASARAPRRPEYDVERVPSTVPLASRLGGEPLPGPQRVAASPEQETPQQGPTFGESDTLEDAQKRERLMRGIAGMARGSSRIGAAIAGIRPEEGAAADLERNAGSQVRDYLMRRQQSEAEKASAEQAALRDPTSPASQRFQAMVSRAFGSVYSPEQIQGMTAADAPLVSKYGEMVRTLEDRAAERGARLAASASEAEKQRAFQAGENAKNRAVDYAQIAAQREQRGDAKDSRLQAAELKLAQKIAERNVGGFEMEDPANPPSAEGAKQMATVATARDKILASLRRMEEDFKDSGTEWGGAAASRMEAEWKNVTDQMRMISDMGVPNGRDYEMLARQIPNPVGPGAMTTLNSTIGAKFPILRQQVADMVNATAKAYKFRPVGGNGTPTAATGAPRRKRDAQGQVWEEQPDGSARMVL